MKILKELFELKKVKPTDFLRRIQTNNYLINRKNFYKFKSRKNIYILNKLNY